MLTAAELDAMDVGQWVVDRNGLDWQRTAYGRWVTAFGERQLVSVDLVRTLHPIRRKETHVEQPMPTASAGPSMHALASRVLKERASIGLDRYGQELQVLNGRDAVRDTIEELADGLAYALQIREERRMLREELETVRDALMGGHVRPGVLDDIIDRYFPS